MNFEIIESDFLIETKTEFIKAKYKINIYVDRYMYPLNHSTNNKLDEIISWLNESKIIFNSLNYANKIIKIKSNGKFLIESLIIKDEKDLVAFKLKWF